MTTYTWIDNDRMASVSGPSAIVNYSYDAEGSRIKEDDGTNSKWYLIDKQLPYGQVIAEYDNSGSLTCSYVYGQDRISMNRGGVAHFYVADGQGSVRQLTDASGNVTDLWTYSAFGEIINRLGSTPNTFTYTGEQWDPNAGYYYLRARWYNPQNGRFTSSDPWEGDPQAPVSLHRYLYGNANPVVYRDPSGNMSIAAIVAVSVMVSVISVQAQPIYAVNTVMSRASYYQASGLFEAFDQNDNKIFDETCYSGYKTGLNNPAMEKVQDTGPIPRGKWWIEKGWTKFTSPVSKKEVKQAIALTPQQSVLPRFGFYIHLGNFTTKTSSRGCIIMSDTNRSKIVKHNKFRCTLTVL